MYRNIKMVYFKVIYFFKLTSFYDKLNDYKGKLAFLEDRRLNGTSVYNKDSLSSSADFGDKYPKGISNTVRAPI